MKYVADKENPSLPAKALENYYLLYKLFKEKLGRETASGKCSFPEFLPWGRNLASFIDLLDTEDIDDEKLKQVEASAAIGYDVPDNINCLLKEIVRIRSLYHGELLRRKTHTRGLRYRLAAESIARVELKEFDMFIFAGFFYIPRTEFKVVEHLLRENKAVLFFQGEEKDLAAMGYSTRKGGFSARRESLPAKEPRIEIYRAFDKHSQVGQAREILKRTGDYAETVIVLPEADILVPLLPEVSSLTADFNVSLGYPLKRSALYALFELIVRAQKNRKGEAYYLKDYLAVLSHPFVKNLRILGRNDTTRVLVHRLEEVLRGDEISASSRLLYFHPDEIMEDDVPFELARRTLANMDIDEETDTLKGLLAKIHKVFFHSWEKADNFRSLSGVLRETLDILVKKSSMRKYPLNLKIAERVLDLKDEYRAATFREEPFPPEELFTVFLDMLGSEFVSFSGSPLRGLQILGILETRALSFKNAIFLDLNDSLVPSLGSEDPLIPKEVKLSLGIGRTEKEAEIQYNNFRRLFSAAENVFLIYEETEEKERSRFLEKIIWDEEKKSGRCGIRRIPAVSFNLFLEHTAPPRAEKNDRIMAFLENFTYSPTSLNRYLHCPLSFYYSYVLGLAEREDINDEPDARQIGRFLHEFLETYFRRFQGGRPVFDKKNENIFWKIFSDRFEESLAGMMKADSFLLREVMRIRLKAFWTNEKNNPARKVKEIISLERVSRVNLAVKGKNFPFKYVIDRVDRLTDGSVLISDYKSGKVGPQPKLSSLSGMEMERTAIKSKLKSFQLPLYYHFEKAKYARESLNACLYGLKDGGLYFFLADQNEAAEKEDLCLKAVDFILREINDIAAPFICDRSDERLCTTCPFFYVCK